MDLATLSALAFTLLLWASAFAGIRAGLEGYTPGHLALLRFLVASLSLAVYAGVAGIRWPHREDLLRIALLGFLGITVYHVALNYGELTVSAGAASLLIASGPIFTALLAVFFLGEQLTLLGWAGIALGFMGVALIALGEGGGLRFSPGAFWIVLAAFSTSFYFVFQKPLHRRYTPLEVTAYTLWAGTMWMLPLFGGLPGEFAAAPAAATWSVVYLGVGPGALAYLTWTFALSRAPASRVTSFLYLSPALAILIAWFWLREWPSPLALLGGGLAILGVLVTQYAGRAPASRGIS